MPRVVCVGGATLDTVALVDRFPRPDERMLAEQLVHAGGGNAATAAVAASRLGCPVQFVGTVGADDVGDQVAAGLADEGVDVRRLTRDTSAPTGASVVVCSRGTSTRAICTRPVPALRLDAGAVEAIRTADWVHADHLGWPAVAPILATLPRSGRPRLVVDEGNPVADDRCDPVDVDVYVPSGAQLRARYGEGPAEKLLRACPAEQVVATFGADGAAGRDADGRIQWVPAFTVEVVSTLGAGDVFHGALLAALAGGRELRDAMAYASGAAALACRGLDGRSAIPTHDALARWLADTEGASA